MQYQKYSFQTTVLIHEIHALTCMYRSIPIIYGFIFDPHDNQFPVGLVIAQLIEHCTSIAEVRVQIPVQAIFATAYVVLKLQDHTHSLIHQIIVLV